MRKVQSADSLLHSEKLIGANVEELPAAMETEAVAMVVEVAVEIRAEIKTAAVVQQAEAVQKVLTTLQTEFVKTIITTANKHGSV